MATPNYGYEKRQKELAKRKKKEEKLKHKAERKSGDGVELTPNEAAEQAALAGAEAPTQPPTVDLSAPAARTVAPSTASSTEPPAV